LTASDGASYIPRMKKTYGKSAVNDKILRIVLRHLGQSAAEKLFRDLSKVGGGKFKTTMKRILVALENADVKVKQP
jgi:hypothetical protein